MSTWNFIFGTQLDLLHQMHEDWPLLNNKIACPAFKRKGASCIYQGYISYCQYCRKLECGENCWSCFDRILSNWKIKVCTLQDTVTQVFSSGFKWRNCASRFLHGQAFQWSTNAMFWVFFVVLALCEQAQCHMFLHCLQKRNQYVFAWCTLDQVDSAQSFTAFPKHCLHFNSMVCRIQNRHWQHCCSHQHLLSPFICICRCYIHWSQLLWTNTTGLKSGRMKRKSTPCSTLCWHFADVRLNNAWGI